MVKFHWSVLVGNIWSHSSEITIDCFRQNHNFCRTLARMFLDHYASRRSRTRDTVKLTVCVSVIFQRLRF